MKRKRKPLPLLPRQFWAVVFRDKLIGPFTDIAEARMWAVDRGCSSIINIYSPLVDEPNKGHEIGHYLSPEEV